MIINMTGGGSGGAALNFDVVWYATESELLAATPKANTIGIISTTEMTGWIIDANQPENMTDGMVWLQVGTESAAEFNALKKNGLQVYPLFAKQYISGELVYKPSKIYQNNEWVDLVTYLFRYGKQSYTWKAIGKRSSSASNNTAKAPTATTNADGSVTLKMTGGTSTMQNRGGYICEQSVDLTNITSITVKADLTPTGGFEFGVYILPLNATYYNEAVARAICYTDSGVVNELSVDLSQFKLSGHYDIFVATYASASQTLTAVIKEVLVQ